MAARDPLERYMLKLINAERADVGLKPLRFDTDLNEAAEQHSEWMLGADRFSHTGQGGSDPQQRMDAAGYDFTGTWSYGENIAWWSSGSPSGYKDEVRVLHNNLMNSSEHRHNILGSGFREIGIGIEIGNFKGQDSVFVTQDFARSGSGAVRGVSGSSSDEFLLADAQQRDATTDFHAGVDSIGLDTIPFSAINTDAAIAYAQSIAGDLIEEWNTFIPDELRDVATLRDDIAFI